ncbi:MAG: HEAT repeat domain-containing protein [Rhodothermales bacterium]
MGSLFNDITSRHFAAQLGREDASERLELLEALETRGDAELLVKKALALLSDEDDRVRLRASEAIAGVGTKEAAEATIEAWETFDEVALEAAVDALAGIGRPAVVATRRQLAHSDGAIRAAAATVLGRVDARTVVPDLARGLADPDPRVVRASARALGRLKAERCLEDLSVVYRRKPESRAAVVDALEWIGTPAAVRRLTAALDDPDEAIRGQAKAALARLRSDQTS